MPNVSGQTSGVVSQGPSQEHPHNSSLALPCPSDPSVPHTSRRILWHSLKGGEGKTYVRPRVGEQWQAHAHGSTKQPRDTNQSRGMWKLTEDRLFWQSQLSNHGAQCRQGAGEVWTCFQEWEEGEGEGGRQAGGKEAEEEGTGQAFAVHTSIAQSSHQPGPYAHLLPGRPLYWALNRGPTVVCSLAF